MRRGGIGRRSKNREDARERLAELIRRALEPPKPRRATKVSRAAKARRVDDKKKARANQGAEASKSGRLRISEQRRVIVSNN